MADKIYVINSAKIGNQDGFRLPRSFFKDYPHLANTSGYIEVLSDNTFLVKLDTKDVAENNEDESIMLSLFLDFLMGDKDYECTPWGSPSYSVLGWQKPCYLLNEGYYQSFQELLDQTDWDNYGHTSGNPKCADCMVHCGYEPTAAIDALKPANMGRAMSSLLSA